MRKVIGWIMVIGGVAGFAYVVLTFSSFVDYDVVGRHSAAEFYLPVGIIFGVYLILLFLASIGIGILKSKEKDTGTFDMILVIVTCLFFVPYIMYRIFLGA